MADDSDLRPIQPDELDAFLTCIVTAMGSTLTPEGRRHHEATLEYDRTLAAFDGTRLVATAQSLTFSMSVPGGGDLPTAGVKGVTTLPTHRRRGLLRSLMRRQLDDIHARGEALACLWATEGSIYPRFGYGLAETGMSISVERPAPAIIAAGVPAAEAGVAIVPAAEHRSVAEPVYERLRPHRPGMHRRTDGAWHRWEDMGANATMVVTDGGYARYTVTSDWGRRGPANQVSIRELMAVTPAAEEALWRYLFALDLAASWNAFHRPLDDPLQWMVDDARALARDIHGGLFLRLVDLGAALSARRYRAPVDTVLEVIDTFCPWNEGRWRLTGDVDGAACARTSDEADLVLSAADVAAAYLGGVGLEDLRRAGRVEERRADAARRADVAFRWSPLPWGVTWF